MKVLIDLQAAQSSGSRHRGIGNYALNLVRSLLLMRRHEWEFHFLINAAFSQSASELAGEFGNELGYSRMHPFWPVEASRSIDETGGFRKSVSILIREMVIRSVNPDVVLLTSLFEGYDDDAVTDITAIDDGPLNIAVIYDLIPLLFPKLYLDTRKARLWYYGVVRGLKKLDLALAISHATRTDVIEHVGLANEAVVTIHGAAIAHRVERAVEPATRLQGWFGIKGKYVLYTGGNERRKNLPFLIRSFALLEGASEGLQLVIVCKIDQESIEQVVIAAGFASRPEFLVFTGYVTDQELFSLYRGCFLFVFPSWYEGLGLPILEAAEHDIPIIAAATSSMSEIIDMPEATFDPYDVVDCAQLITKGVVNEQFRSRLVANSARIKQRYSWTATASAAADAIEAVLRRKRQDRTHNGSSLARQPRLANITPLMPAQSGVAVYAHSAIPALARHADVASVTDQSDVTDAEVLVSSRIVSTKEFIALSSRFDIINYHIGNSHFHWSDLAMLQHTPGSIVLHDPFLSGVVTSESHRAADPVALFRAYDMSHGLEVAVAHAERPFGSAGSASNWLLSFWAVGPATSVLVHSNYAKALLTAQYGSRIGNKIEVISLPLRLPPGRDKKAAKRSVGVLPDEIIVCSFGFVAPIKGIEEIVEGWIRLARRHSTPVRLVLVGRAASEAFGHQLNERVARAGLSDQFTITGFVDAAVYERYLWAADIAVQLRKSGRGESSASIAECLVHGLPTIVCENGSLAEYPRDVVCMLPNQFTSSDIADNLHRLITDSEQRIVMSEKARRYAAVEFDPETHASKIVTQARSSTESNAFWRTALLRRMSGTVSVDLISFDRHVLPEAITLTFPFETSKPRIFFDVSADDSGTFFGGVLAAVREASNKEVLLDLLDASQERFAVSTDTVSRVLDKNVPFYGILPRYLSDQDIIVFTIDSRIDARNVKQLQGFGLRGGRSYILADSAELLAHMLVPETLAALISYAIDFNTKLLVTDRSMPGLVNCLDQFIDRRGELTVILFNEAQFSSDVTQLMLNRPVGGAEHHIGGTEHSIELGLRRYFPASDERLRVGAGRRIGPMLVTVRKQGHMVFGPYISLAPGRYRVSMTLQVEVAGYARLEILGRSTSKRPVSLGDVTLLSHVTGHHTVETIVQVEAPLTDVEVQFYVSTSTSLGLKAVEFICHPLN